MFWPTSGTLPLMMCWHLEHFLSSPEVFSREARLSRTKFSTGFHKARLWWLGNINCIIVWGNMSQNNLVSHRRCFTNLKALSDDFRPSSSCRNAWLHSLICERADYSPPPVPFRYSNAATGRHAPLYWCSLLTSVFTAFPPPLGVTGHNIHWILCCCTVCSAVELFTSRSQIAHQPWLATWCIIQLDTTYLLALAYKEMMHMTGPE